MERKYSEPLVQEVLRQFQEMPWAIRTMSLDESRLLAILDKTKAALDSGRMQFKIKKKKENQLKQEVSDELPENALEDHIDMRTDGSSYDSLDNSGGGKKMRAQMFYPRRILTNYETDYNPGRLVKAWREAKERLFDRKISAFDSEVINRYWRQVPEITEMRHKAFDSGSPFSLEVLFEIDMRCKEEHHGGSLPIRMPLFFVPGATEEDINALAAYSVLYQTPCDCTSKSWFSGYRGLFTRAIYRANEACCKPFEEED